MPVDIDKAEEKVKKASGFFDTLNAFIKKHPIWTLIIIAVLVEGGHLSWILGHDEQGAESYSDEYYDEYYQEDYSYDDEDLYEDADTTYYYEQQIKK